MFQKSGEWSVCLLILHRAWPMLFRVNETRLPVGRHLYWSPVIRHHSRLLWSRDDIVLFTRSCWFVVRFFFRETMGSYWRRFFIAVIGVVGVCFATDSASNSTKIKRCKSLSKTRSNHNYGPELSSCMELDITWHTCYRFQRIVTEKRIFCLINCAKLILISFIINVLN